MRRWWKVGLPLLFPLLLTACHPGGIHYGSTVSGRIDAVGESDTYTFDAAASDEILVRIRDDIGNPLDPQLSVRRGGASGTPVPGCANFSSSLVELECGPLEAGQHTIVVDDNGGDETGNYYLHLQRKQNPVGATAIAFGQTLVGSIADPSSTHAFTFTVETNDRILLRVRPSGTVTPQARLYDPAGNEVCSASVGFLDFSCGLLVAGQHTLIVNDLTAVYQGLFRLHLQRLNNPGSATAIAFGQTLTGRIGVRAEADAFTFTAPAGAVVRSRVDATGFEPELRVYSPIGSPVCAGAGQTSVDLNPCNGQLVAGRHTILVMARFGSTTGSYQLLLEQLS